jgi:peptidoglycan/LPS O-acetylase OafA/YrhL
MAQLQTRFGRTTVQSMLTAMIDRNRVEMTVAPGGLPEPTPRAHIPALDGLRGGAILMVLIAHSVPRVPRTTVPAVVFNAAVHSGVFGVDLFFVLSGFLITGILLDSKESPRYFRSFYVRRALRLFPVYYTFLFVLAIVLPALGGLLQIPVPRYGGNWWWYVSYFSNWKPQYDLDGPLGQFWSLALEEQFYLLWPTTVYLLSRRVLAWTCIGLCAVAIVTRMAADALAISFYAATPCRFDALALGALAALAIRDDSWRQRLVVHARKAGLLFGLVLEISILQDWRNPWNLISATPAVVVFGLIVFAAADSDGPIAKFFAHPFLRRYGRYSYCIYVIHLLILNSASQIATQIAGGPPRGLQFAVAVLCSLIANVIIYNIARVSWRCLEEPILRLKDRWAPME